MILAIRHYPDRKRPCLVLEENNQAVVLGYLTNRKREKWLRKAYDIDNSKYEWALPISPSKYTLDEILEKEVEE